jgi:diketogulonate reductase-like aldo/keto reductase
MKNIQDYLFQKELLDFCLSHHVRLIAYRPFGKGELLGEPLFQFIGKKKNKSPSQVILRWLVQRNIPAIPKASSIEHLRANLDVFDFILSEEEMGKIDALHRNIRYCMRDFAEFSY